MSGWLLWTTLDVFILDWLSSSYSRPTQPDPTRRFSLTHDEAFDIDVTLQLKPMLGIPAPLWPQDQPFSVTQTGPRTNQLRNGCMYGGTDG